MQVIDNISNILKLGRKMQEINPITNKIADLRGRMESLRGYL